jgi:hypothetical protein
MKGWSATEAPVDARIWLTSHLPIKSASRIFFFVPQHTFYDERDFDYRRTAAHVLSACERHSEGSQSRSMR